jgi:signal transduction histidine kinase
MNIPAIFPIINLGSFEMTGGCTHHLPRECLSFIDCGTYYESLKTKPDGFYLCPHGFSSRLFSANATRYSIIGMIAQPRFDTSKERLSAKKYNKNHAARFDLDGFAAAVQQFDELKASTVIEASKVLPQAFHELRKLNGSVLKSAEIEIGSGRDTSNLKVIKGASELMRNNFDILEALSNMDAMRALPADNTIRVFPLAFKMKRILESRAKDKGMRINIEGDSEGSIKGSAKSFPIVFATLIENAIKYGRSNSDIDVTISVTDEILEITVENFSDQMMDPRRCFERGVRFSTSEEGGGFGLYLAKEIVESHGGRISCSVELPLVSMRIVFAGR